MNNRFFAPPAPQSNFTPNINGIPGGTYQIPGGPQIHASVIGGSSTGYNYMTSASQPLSPTTFVHAQATNCTPNGEHQAQAGIGFRF